ncbi:NAD-dependent epimerase/dehydratase family protein [Bradyrhizobium elkanii]|uniref:NAD-dependent epimerase/dehydratase family protein n=1 Tax=Bradyrhizobium elkanii TaxID=29448 RepID=UPI002711F31C|nr:NAD-dependent epimerase/dehydratase family protein [Bradyrhizobium elkanii]WLA38513.1 NAD-dependent epimerase/dehydratase family protein [Bradyrhizobium elkanii]
MAQQTKRKVLITGGTGFIGSNLAMRLLETDTEVEVVLFDRNPDLSRLTGFKSSVPGVKDRYTPVKDRITFVQGDLTILPHVLALFDNHEPDSVFHLGALLSAGAESNPTMGFKVDTVGSWHVFEAARIYCQHAGRPPIRLLFPSTIASFGQFIAAGALVPNEAVQMPTTMYGVAKVSVERLGEYYTRKGWIDFRAVRYPSVIGASRGPGGTTVYSTLMVQEPARDPPRPYFAYVGADTRLDIIYISEALDAIVGLHDAPAAALVKSNRRVYNIAGFRNAGQAPTAAEIKAAVLAQIPAARIEFSTTPIEATVKSFGVLDDSAAMADWAWKKQGRLDLNKAVEAFIDEVRAYPDRIKSLELFGA